MQATTATPSTPALKIMKVRKAAIASTMGMSARSNGPRGSGMRSGRSRLRSRHQSSAAPSVIEQAASARHSGSAVVHWMPG